MADSYQALFNYDRVGDTQSSSLATPTLTQPATQGESTLDTTNTAFEQRLKYLAHDSDSTNDDFTAPPVKRGPGRPKKSANVSSQPNKRSSSTLDASNGIPVKRGPGRPPKSSKTSTNTTSNKINIPAKRGRGRPPKSATPNTKPTNLPRIKKVTFTSDDDDFADIGSTPQAMSRMKESYKANYDLTNRGSGDIGLQGSDDDDDGASDDDDDDNDGEDDDDDDDDDDSLQSEDDLDTRNRGIDSDSSSDFINFSDGDHDSLDDDDSDGGDSISQFNKHGDNISLNTDLSTLSHYKRRPFELAGNTNQVFLPDHHQYQRKRKRQEGEHEPTITHPSTSTHIEKNYGNDYNNGYNNDHNSFLNISPNDGQISGTNSGYSKPYSNSYSNIYNGSHNIGYKNPYNDSNNIGYNNPYNGPQNNPSNNGYSASYNNPYSNDPSNAPYNNPYITGPSNGNNNDNSDGGDIGTPNLLPPAKDNDLTPGPSAPPPQQPSFNTKVDLTSVEMDYLDEIMEAQRYREKRSQYWQEQKDKSVVQRDPIQGTIFNGPIQIDVTTMDDIARAQQNSEKERVDRRKERKVKNKHTSVPSGILTWRRPLINTLKIGKKANKRTGPETNRSIQTRLKASLVFWFRSVLKSKGYSEPTKQHKEIMRRFIDKFIDKLPFLDVKARPFSNALRRLSTDAAGPDEMDRLFTRIKRSLRLYVQELVNDVALGRQLDDWQTEQLVRNGLGQKEELANQYRNKLTNHGITDKDKEAKDIDRYVLHLKKLPTSRHIPHRM
ncbi:hypothetical protein BC941DRAFT_441416 [Chlamydoabsidia padenii]|nr:hypothetical protein BC941DRAFT_441416 [Chlamydoabsidia padenii]